MYHQLNKRSITALYSTASLIFAFYGVFVCPFIESLSSLFIFLEVSFALLIMLALRFSIFPKWLDKKPALLFYIDAINFTVVGFFLAMFMGYAHHFPIESNLKVIFGMVMLGAFTGILINQLHLVGKYELMLDRGEFTTQVYGERKSITKQFISLVVLLVTSLSTTLVMVAVKDLFWLEGDINRYLSGEGKISIIKEFIFVSVVLFLYTLAVIFLWGKKLSLILISKEQALDRVTQGALNERLPVYNHDEFGVLASLTNDMLSSLEESQSEIQQTRDSAIVGLAALAESRDNETGAHILRTQAYIRVLAYDLKERQMHTDCLTEDYISLLYKSAPLHDVGKVGIPDRILLKPGKLTEDEFEIMKGHPLIGAKALSIAESQMKTKSSFLLLAKEIALTHHEKWNGTGYPQQLKGNDIPLSGRLMALADVYDALISKRVYKPGFSHEKAKAIILEGKGTHFDPDIVDAFIHVEDKFQQIAQQYQDN